MSSLSVGAAMRRHTQRGWVEGRVVSENRALRTVTVEWADGSRSHVPCAAEHERDEDCAATIDADGQCTVCGVSHTATCPACGGCGFHKAGCPDGDEDQPPYRGVPRDPQAERFGLDA